MKCHNSDHESYHKTAAWLRLKDFFANTLWRQTLERPGSDTLLKAVAIIQQCWNHYQASYQSCFHYQAYIIHPYKVSIHPCDSMCLSFFLSPGYESKSGTTFLPIRFCLVELSVITHGVPQNLIVSQASPNKTNKHHFYPSCSTSPLAQQESPWVPRRSFATTMPNI